MAAMREGRNGGKLKSGNTKNVGRPKLPDLKEAMAKILGEEKDGKIALEAILAGLRAKAVRGDARAAELLLKYTYRQPTQEVDITTNGKEIRSWTVKSV
jgi:hypothetical protein